MYDLLRNLKCAECGNPIAESCAQATRLFGCVVLPTAEAQERYEVWCPLCAQVEEARHVLHGHWRCPECAQPELQGRIFRDALRVGGFVEWVDTAPTNNDVVGRPDNEFTCGFGARVEAPTCDLFLTHNPVAPTVDPGPPTPKKKVPAGLPCRCNRCRG